MRVRGSLPHGSVKYTESDDEDYGESDGEEEFPKVKAKAKAAPKARAVPTAKPAAATNTKPAAAKTKPSAKAKKAKQSDSDSEEDFVFKPEAPLARVGGARPGRAAAQKALARVVDDESDDEEHAAERDERHSAQCRDAPHVRQRRRDEQCEHRSRTRLSHIKSPRAELFVGAERRDVQSVAQVQPDSR